MRLFAGPISGWLPVIVGPEEGTWRAVTPGLPAPWGGGPEPKRL